MSTRQVVRSWNVLGTQYPVVRTELGSTVEGEYDPSNGEIQVDVNNPSHRFWEVESHELGHTVSHAVGFARSLCENFGLSVEVANKIEEEWVSRVLPVYLDTLQRGGALTPPSPPTMPEEGDS